MTIVWGKREVKYRLLRQATLGFYHTLSLFSKYALCSFDGNQGSLGTHFTLNDSTNRTLSTVS